MINLSWYELNPPRELDLDAVTGLIRPLATRPISGIMATVPVVVFELWDHGGSQISWRIGIESTSTTAITAHLTAQLPSIGLSPLEDAPRSALTLAAEVSTFGWSSLLRLEMAAAVSAGLYGTLRQLRPGETAVMRWTVGPSRPRQARPADLSWTELFGLRSPKKPDATALRLWREKSTEPIFAVRGYIGAGASSSERAAALIQRLGDGLRLANSAHAGVRLGRVSHAGVRKMDTLRRLPGSWSGVLNAAELASVLGWPVEATPSDDLQVIGGHIGRAPSSLLVAADGERSPRERILGESLHPAQRGELVTVPIDTSLHHTHIVGPTGSGKSTLLAGLVGADIASGRAVLLLDPKGDLVTDVLARVPEHRRDDVVVIEPDSVRSVGINVLAGDTSQAERRADQIVHLLSELHGGNLGPRSTDVALHALITASRLPDGTLADVPILLTNPAFRRRVLAQVADPLVLTPWWSWFNALSEAERGQVVAPLLNKLRAFLSRDALRRMLGQSNPKFTLDELFSGNRRRIVLINLNRGSLGPETASLLGALILTQAWAAIQRRASLDPDHRHPVMVTIDEVQDYLHLPGVDLGDFFAQARGLGVAVTVAHQHLDQLSATQRAGIMANARSLVTFHPAAADARPLAASLGGGLDGDDLLRLRAYEACCQLLVAGQPSMPFSVRTKPLPPWLGDPNELKRTSAERYGVDGDQLDDTLTRRWQGGDATSNTPIGIRKRRSS